MEQLPLTGSTYIDLPSSSSISPNPTFATTANNNGINNGLGTIKRFKPIETCDNCKERKVKCDRERPICGTCNRTKRECTYNFSASSKRERPRSEYEILQEQIEEVATIQFDQLNQLENMLENLIGNNGLPQATVAAPGQGDFNDIIQNGGASNSYVENFIPNPMANNFYGMYQTEEMSRPSLNQSISEETLQFTAQLASTLPKTNKPPSITTNINNASSQYTSDNMQFSDPVDKLTDELNSLNLFESTRYIGEGSLLMLSDGGEETIVPQTPTNLSQVEPELKLIPNPVAAKYLIDLYYQRVYRHYPHLRRKIVDDCLANLSKPQHFLLLNSIFFAASPFHADKDLRDGKPYHKRAIALLQNHCLQTPHVLTVVSLFILGLHTRTMGSAWIFHGMGSKMTFELGLHRKIKKIQMSDAIKEMRDMAFWGCFVAETWVSACYGRPSAIDEATCDVDLLPIPSDPEPDEETRLHIAWILHINLLRIFAQVRKYLYGRSKIEGTKREENQFRFLDAALGRWFYTLPNWLKFEEMATDVKGSLLGSIGGEMHTLFWTVLILLHSLNLTMFTTSPTNPTQEANRLSSQTICVHAATILLHWLDVLMNQVPDFFEQSCTALFAIAPAIRVLAWTTQRGDTKAESMVERLKEIKNEVKEIARRRFASGRLDGEEKLQGWFGKLKEEEAKNNKSPEAAAASSSSLSPDQVKNLSARGRNPNIARRRNNKSSDWRGETDNFKFTFDPASLENFHEQTQQSIPFQVYTDQQQLAPHQTDYNNQTYPDMQFSSTLSPPPNISSASTSPHPTVLSPHIDAPFNTPIFTGINNFIQPQQQLDIHNPVNFWNPSLNNNQYGVGFDAKIMMENGSNIVGHSNEEYVPTI
ncbi:11644_t:CDS:10 [Ambispora gerdemannii]|uniref:11644_t:CDS:1 n=1 Tax=Ambispora gerdemannii TaxID=144530 RepID=A0A9N9FTX7_9GLOM|nr:11644_t:CDS:10 [Ambispora gerdemannii]